MAVIACSGPADDDGAPPPAVSADADTAQPEVDPEDGPEDGPEADDGGPAAGTGPLPADVEAATPPRWLCHPDLDDDPCRRVPDTTVIAADGARSVAPGGPAAATPAVDCFYVYPTASLEPSATASGEVTAEIAAVARSQAAPFAGTCRVFAPTYRQVTLRGLVTGACTDPAARDLAHADVLAAWRSFRDAAGDRPYVLVGHSQGADELVRLLATTIEADTATHDDLVLALLIGGQVEVPTGEDVGGSLARTPVCREAGQTGCVVAYNAYVGQPSPVALFGRGSGDREVVCVEPGSLDGGDGTLTPVLTGDVVGDVDTATVRPVGAATGRCRRDGASSWLDVELTGVLADAAPRLTGGLGAAWGLHLVDVELALGDLVDLVASRTVDG